MPGADAQSLIPKPNADDTEDVAWALSTAAALWGRGEYSDAVSWIRKAAMSAGEVEADVREIELAKAAADLATLVEAATQNKSVVMASASSAESIDAIEVVDPDPGPKKAPPPPRPPLKKDGRALQTPLPNEVPASLQQVSASELAVAPLDAPVEEEEIAPASIRRIDSRAPPAPAGDSSVKVPTAPPMPDLHPTPQEMRVAPTVTASAPKVAVPRPNKSERLVTAIAVAPALDLRESTRPPVHEPPSKLAVPKAPSGPQIAPRKAPSVHPLAAANIESDRPPPAPSMTETHEGIGPPSRFPPAKQVAIDPTRFEALADIPDDERGAILALGEVVALLPEEETTAPFLALIVQGDVEVRAPGHASTLEIVSADQMRLFAPTLPARSSLVLVGGKRGARLLALPPDAIDRLKAVAPWVVQDLEPACDDLHVVAGALVGEIGRRLDANVITAILQRAETMRLEPGAVVCRNGELVRALVILGAGALSLRVGDASDAQEIGTIEPGEIVFSHELLSRSKAPSTVRAGAEGALVLVATRAATEELMLEYPPLLEVLAE